MKWTNKLNLPEPLVQAIVNSDYTRGKSDITATEIISPIRIQVLKERHEDELISDVSDSIYSLQGQSVHSILERAGKSLDQTEWLIEKRLYIKVGGKTLGAQIDLFNTKTGVLQDYKVTSVYSVKNGLKEEYVKQLNIGAECLRQAGFKVTTLQIIAILRDWSKGELERDLSYMGELASYPKHQVVVLDVPLIPSGEVTAYLEAQVASRNAASAGDLPLCTKEERWARDDTYAVMKKGQKRAVKLFASEKSANEFISTLGKDHSIQFRSGESIRCKSYCPVSSWCDQHKNKGKINGEE